MSPLPRLQLTIAFVLAVVSAASLSPALVTQSREPVLQSADVLVTQPRPLSEAYQAPVLAQDPGRAGHLAMAYQEGTHLNRCYLGLSSNSGKTWVATALVGLGAAHSLPPGVTHCQNPLVVFAPDGTLYYGFQDSGFRSLEPESIHVLLMVSTDGGATFRDPQILDPAAMKANDWYLSLASSHDGKHLYAAWTRYAQNFTVFPGYPELTTSVDRGRTFAEPVSILPRDNPVYVGGPALAVGTDERVYVAFLPSPPGRFGLAPGELKVAHSSDLGATFATSSLGQIIAATGCPPGVPVCKKMRVSGRIESIAAGRAPGQVFIVWWDDRGPDELGRISFARSSDGGGSWTVPRIVGVPKGGDLHQQHRPSLSVAPDGTVYIAYYDLAPDGHQDVLLISSSNAGTSFVGPRRMNSVSGDATVGPGTAGRATANLGDSLALVATGTQAFVAWTDARRGTQTSGHQDVAFAAAAPVGAQPRFPALAVILAALPVGAALIGVLVLVRHRRRESLSTA